MVVTRLMAERAFEEANRVAQEEFEAWLEETDALLSGDADRLHSELQERVFEAGFGIEGGALIVFRGGEDVKPGLLRAVTKEFASGFDHHWDNDTADKLIYTGAWLVECTAAELPGKLAEFKAQPKEEIYYLIAAVMDTEASVDDMISGQSWPEDTIVVNLQTKSVLRVEM